MSQSQSVLLKAKGLYTFPNLLSEVPQGALQQADNVVINRDGIIEPRRGFKIYGDEMGSSSTTDQAKQFLIYKNRIIRFFSTTMEFDDGTGNFTALSGSYSPTETGLRIKGIESNGNLYFTTSKGVKKLSSADAASIGSNTVVDAGGLKALDTQLSLNSQSGFFTQESKVAYRIVWGIKDQNNNLVLGAPSQRAVIENPLTNLLIPNFNKLLTDLDAAAVADAGVDLGDTDYYATWNIPLYSSAVVIQSSMSGLCTKLNGDFGGTPFTATKDLIDAIDFSSGVPTSQQLLLLQEYYDSIVTQLNSYIGAASSPKIDAMIDDFEQSTQSATVDLDITIPDGATTAHFYQVYRTALALSTGAGSLSDIDPGDEEGLVYEANPTIGELAQGYIEFTDVTPDSFRGANLYTNPNSGEGIGQANEVPPKAKDIARYKNYVFYANTETKYRKQINLLSVTELVAGVSKLTITSGATVNTYTFDTTEDVATKKVLISTLDTPAQQVDETARSLVHVVNRNDDDLVYAYYLSGPTDVPGLILFETRTLIDDPFSFTVDNDTTGTQFSPIIPTSGTSVVADNEVSPNRVYYSKDSQPDAVPLLNYFDVGPKDKKILRILALRESLFIFKQEAIYRVSGDTAPFVQNLFDSSTILLAPDTASVLNNEIYLLSSQGVVKISDTGVGIISRPIEGDLIKLGIPSYTNFKTASFGQGYESDRTYYLWTVTNKTDTVATQCFRYNTLTQTWVRSPMMTTCAVVNPENDKLYLGSGNINFIEEERKNFDRTDYADREYNSNLAEGSVTDDVITFPSITNISARDILIQVQYLTIKQFNRLLDKLDNDNGVTDDNYVALLEATSGMDLRDQLTSLAVKLDNDPGITDSNYVSSISSYTSSFPDCQSAFNVIVTKLNADTGVLGFNYLSSTGTTTYEVVITSVDKTNVQVTTEYAFPFIAGLVTTYKSIDSVVRWAPQAFGDPSLLKQVSEGTLLFDKVTFTQVDFQFSSDLNPGFEGDTFRGTGTGIFGNGVFGNEIFGGDGNSIPFRTLVPREKQRCRYLHVRFEHNTAREAFAIYGLSLTPNPTSARAYK